MASTPAFVALGIISSFVLLCAIALWRYVETIDSKPSNYTVAELKDDRDFRSAVHRLDSAGAVYINEYEFPTSGSAIKKPEQRKRESADQSK